MPFVAGTDGSPVLRLPGRRFNPLQTLAQRFAGATLLILIVAALAYVDRSGYVDNGGDGTLSLLDSVYYATVTLTTTGYGDIYPASEGARAITAFVITPLRVIFLVLLVGTTVEILTESTRQAWRVRRWREHVKDHTIICGYGAKGANAAAALLGNGAGVHEVVIVEPNHDRAQAALRAGHAVVEADATRRATLREADIADARAVVVAVDRDDTAVLTVLTARELNSRAHIAATVREEENGHLLRQSGASTVVPSTSAAGRLVGIATYSPALVSVLEDLLSTGRGIDIAEREVRPGETGLDDVAHEQVILVLRGEECLLWNDPRCEPLRAGDRLVELTTAPVA